MTRLWFVGWSEASGQRFSDVEGSVARARRRLWPWRVWLFGWPVWRMADSGEVVSYNPVHLEAVSAMPVPAPVVSL